MRCWANWLVKRVNERLRERLVERGNEQAEILVDMLRGEVG